MWTDQISDLSIALWETPVVNFQTQLVISVNGCKYYCEKQQGYVSLNIVPIYVIFLNVFWNKVFKKNFQTQNLNLAKAFDLGEKSKYGS